MTIIPPNDPFQNAKDDAQAGRKAERDSLFLIGNLEFEGSPTVYPIRIRNLSATGLMADGKIVGQIGQNVIIESKKLGRVRGHVAWVSEGRMGIAFSNPIDPRSARQTSSHPTSEVPEYLKQLASHKPSWQKPRG
jgi:hypothetical protein